MLRKVHIKKQLAPSRHRAPWMVRWRTADGKQHKASFPKRRQAQEYAAEITRQINIEMLGGVNSIPWAEMVEAYRTYSQSRQLAESTITMTTKYLGQFAEIANSPNSGDIRLQHADNFMAAQTGTAVTINKKLRHLKAVFSWAKKRKYLRENPFDDIDKIKEEKRIKQIITPQQFQAILAACCPQWRLMCLLHVNGVARKSSIAALTIGAIDVENECIIARDGKQKQERITPLHPAIFKELIEYLEKIPPGRKNLFTLKFHNSGWTHALARAKVPYFKFHDLRTCVSTWLQNDGVSVGVVQSLFGHSSPNVTAEHYTAIDTAAKRAAVNRLPL